MTTKHLLWAIEDEELPFSSAPARYVFLLIAYHADRKRILRRSQAEIARESRYSRGTVARAFDELLAHGLIKRLGHGRYGLTGDQDRSDD